MNWIGAKRGAVDAGWPNRPVASPRLLVGQHLCFGRLAEMLGGGLRVRLTSG
jgi:hypothetical protein